jgi:hypothetical protein
MQASPPDRLVLRRATQRLSRRDLWILSIVVALLGAATLLTFHVVVGDRELDWAGAGRKLADAPAKLLGRPDFLAQMVFGVLAIWYLIRSVRYERLILDASGIRYQSPLPAAFARVQPGWSHSWTQIRAAEIGMPRIVGSQGFVLVTLDAVTVKRKIAGRWVAEGAAGEAPASSSFSFWRRPADTALRDAEQSPLVQFMRRMGVQVTVQTKASSGFAIESNPAALAAAVAAPVLLAYAAIDFAINTEIYAVRPPLELLAGGGILAFFLVAVVLTRFQVPGAETTGLAVLVGLVVSAALYPGLLRINQVTDVDGLRGYEYRLRNDWLWEPRDGALPTLSFTDYYEYWSQFKPGVRKEFQLRKGGLGFWQVEMAPVNDEMRAYYRKNP